MIFQVLCLAQARAHDWFPTGFETFVKKFDESFVMRRVCPRDKPVWTIVFRNDRFEFPLDTCYDNLGMFTPQGVLNATLP